MARVIALAAVLVCSSVVPASAQQAPWGDERPIGQGDRVYAAEQFSNTLSVTDPVANKLIGVIKLGEPQPANLSPLYRGQVLVHGLGFSRDGRTLAVVSIGSNAVTFIDTATNSVKHTTYLGRSPHEAFFTPDGKEVWVTIRGEDYVSVLDSNTYQEKTRLRTPNGPGMTTFSLDGKYAYICSSFSPELVVYDVAKHTVAGKVVQPSPFCPNIAASPDGEQVWFTLKDVGKTVVMSAAPPFAVIKVIDTGPITNHVNFARTQKGLLAYVTVGGLNQVKVIRTDDFKQVAKIPVGDMPHGIWPSGDGKRVYVGLENADALAVIDTRLNKVVASVPIGQGPQAIAYVPNAAPNSSQASLQPLGLAAKSTRLTLAPIGSGDGAAPTRVTLFDQGLTQVLQASVNGLPPKQPFLLALANSPDGSGALEPLARFMTNPAGSAIVNAVGPIRQLVRPESGRFERRYLIIVAGADPVSGSKPVQVQRD